MKQHVSLSDSEWIIMQEIWKRETSTFREICDGVAAQNWSKPAVAAFLKRFRESRLVNNVFYGLRPASAAMVAAAGLSVVGLALLYSGQAGLAAVNWKAVALAAVLLVLTRWCKPTKGLHPIVFILASAIIGVVFSF